MPETARIARRISASIFLVAALCTVTGQVAAASGSAARGSQTTTAAVVHTAGLPCVSCNGGT